MAGKGSTSDRATFRSWTGYDANGVTGDPRFVNRAARDYHLDAGSPAIDRGLPIGEPYAGIAPGLGRHER